MYHICWSEQTSFPGWRDREQKEKGQDSDYSDACGNAAIDFHGAQILARAFFPNQHLCHVFKSDVIDKDQKEGDAVASAVVPSQANHCHSLT